MELFIPVTFVVAIVEMILSGTWSRLYFSYGVPVFSYEPDSKKPSAKTLDSEILENSLQVGKYVPIKLRQFSSQLFGFREAAGGGFGKLSYTPVMHGKLLIQDNGQIRVVGLVNWFTVTFSILFVGVPIQWGQGHPITFIFPVFLFGLLGWIYITQRKRFIELAEAAAAQTSAT